MNRAAVVALAALAVVVGLGVGVVAGLVSGSASPAPASSGLVAGLGVTPPTALPPAGAPGGSRPIGSVSPAGPPLGPNPSAAPTTRPGSALVPAPLSGRLVTPAAAARHPIAVMIDDHRAARPQSGFSAASVVWQAPAEGGIPRYMLVFQENIPGAVGPVRSARLYYIAWAAEQRALYVHSGGSPQALSTLRAKGRGQLVYNADEFRFGGSFRRLATRFSPHNLYTTGKQLRALAAATGATDVPVAPPWRFGPDTPFARRPIGGRIQVAYRYNAIRYDYDRKSNTYRRSVTGERSQVDGTTRRRVSPTNVIVMVVRFGPLNDGTTKLRLDAEVVGRGTAWIAANGTTIKGTWKKTALTEPTRFFDSSGRAVTLAVGQTFIQVMPQGSRLTFTAGKPPPRQPAAAGPRPH